MSLFGAGPRAEARLSFELAFLRVSAGAATLHLDLAAVPLPVHQAGSLALESDEHETRFVHSSVS